MKYSYGIGLDIGIASVGWAVVALDENAEPYGLMRLGSRVFDKAEQPKTGESLAAPRRAARSMRRQVRRRKLRKSDLYALLYKNGLPSKVEIDQAVQRGRLEDIYALRTRALDEVVTLLEFSRILLHLMQRRGFKSNRLSDAPAEEGKLLTAVSANRELMAQNGYRTVGEMFYRDGKFNGHKRNSGEEYFCTVTRDMVVAEANALFEAQRACGNPSASLELQADYLSLLTRQRSFDEGPGQPSPYISILSKNHVGRCTLEEGQPRAAKCTYSFERFRLLEKINHIRIEENGTARSLTDKERARLIELPYKYPSVDFVRIRKELNLGNSARFNIVRYQGDDIAICEHKAKLPALRGYHAIRKAMDSVKKGHINCMTPEQLDLAATFLTLYRNEDTVRKCLQEADFEPFEIDALLKAGSFSGFGHLSITACRKLNPYLEQGMTYYEACVAAGYNFKSNYDGEKSTLLPAVSPEIDDITNPVVRRAIAQTIKVVNAIIRDQGASPVWVNIELARELSKSFEERNHIEKAIQENTAENERLIKDLQELGFLNPTGQDLVKYRLWREQDGRCAYSLQPIMLERLFEPGYAEIDHIVPYSISFDDRRTNKVLVLAAENRQKGNRLPLQYLQGEKREQFIVYTNSNVRNYRKRQNLLRETLNEDEIAGFKQRNLQDTQYIASFLRGYIADHLIFAPHPKAGKERVTPVNGAVTSYLRKRWGLVKVRANGDLHHALDAVVIACTTHGMIQQVSRFASRKESGTSLHEKFPEPWPNFRNDLMQRLSSVPQENLMKFNPEFYASFDIASIKPVFVSRMPRHSVTGAAHKETIKGHDNMLGDNFAVVHKQLSDLKLDKNGEILGYYNPSSDTLLYGALKKRLLQFGGDGKKAFTEPFHKPKSNGEDGPLVTKVKVYEKVTSVVSIHDGAAVADNDTMVRVDVYHVPGDGYYWVPIYVADTLKPELPNKAVIANKPKSEWKIMDEKYFIFSLHKNDLILVEKKDSIKFKLQNKDATLEKEVLLNKLLVYFEGGNISTGAITVTTADNAYVAGSLGFKSLIKVQKYQIDVLGNYTPVRHETLQHFNLRNKGGKG